MRTFKKYLFVTKDDTGKYRLADASCDYYSNAVKGAQVEVVAGKKIPIGTKAEVKYISVNQFDRRIHPLTGEVYNPRVLLIMPDKTEVWTSGKNLINTTPQNAETRVVCFEHTNETVPKLAFTLLKNFENKDLKEAVRLFEAKEV